MNDTQELISMVLLYICSMAFGGIVTALYFIDVIIPRMRRIDAINSTSLTYSNRKMAQATTGTKAPQVRTQTFGEKLVGLSFNPSGDALVDVVKRSHADVIDHLEQERQDASDRGESLKAQLFSEAIIKQLDGCMMSVRAITFN